MTYTVKLSDLAISAEDFAARVLAHFERLVEYYKHLEGVAADAKDDSLKPEDRRVAFPPPSEDEKVELAIYRERHADGSITPHIDYQIEGPTLDEKKAALTNQVREHERAAIDKVMPLPKRRHWDYREHDIRTVDHARLRNHPERIDDPDTFLLKTRAPEDTQFLVEHAQRRHQVDTIQRAAAKHEHDIADLTHETVDAYKVGGEFS